MFYNSPKHKHSCFAIYRGAGGAGDATNDSSSETRLAVEARDAAIAAKVAAEAAQAAAQTAETNAETAETNAETAETNAETAATNAASSASAASSSASSASSSASAASTSASNASTSASGASTSATNASNSASAASTSATNASNSASTAATSATNASNSASAASTSATNAANSATSASSSASTATTQATNASNSATTAGTSATNAANSATSASTSASTATTQATNASNSASAASTSATNASSSASAASTSASNASTSATAAQSAQSSAEAARDAALSAYDNFDDRYLGPKSSDPSLDNDGNALVTGALYFNTTSNVMKVYTGSAWVAAYVSAAGVLLAVNNLSDLNNTATARTNLGVAIGTNVQAWDADLDTWSTKTAPSGTVVGTSDSQTLTNKTISGSSNTISNISLSTQVTGTLPIANGGTNATTAATAISNLGGVPLAGGVSMTGSLYTSGSFGMKGNVTGNPVMYDVQDQAGATVLEIGRADNIAATTAMDIHTGSTSVDYDTRLQFTGGNGTSGNGTLNILAGVLQFNSQAITTASNTQTLTNKTIALGSNTVSGTLAQFNTAVTDADFASIAGTETLTNKTLTSPVVTGGSINNAAVGATTPSTGAFTTLSATGVATVSAGTVSAPAITTSGDTNTGIFFPAADTIAFTEGGAEAMRIDSSGNLCIGTLTAQRKLTVSGSDATGNGVGVINTNTAANTTKYSTVDYFGTDTIGTVKLSGYVRALPEDANYVASAMTFATRSGDAAAERMRIGSSGNVGIGTSTPASKLHVAGSFRQTGATAPFEWTVNSGAADFYKLNAVGYADNLIVATSAGNVGIGTSSPTTKLSVVSATNAGISVNDGTVNTIIYNSTGGVASIGTTTNHPVDFYANNSARMRLDTSGNLGLGTSSPNEKLMVVGAGKFTGQATSLDQAGAYIDYSSSVARIAGQGSSGGTLAFYTNPNGGFNAERMRIDSSGNLQIGTTSAGIANTLSTTVETSAANNSRITVNHSSVAGSSNDSNYMQFGYGGNLIGRIVQASTTTVSYTTSSDYRLKENIAPMTGALDKVALLKPCTYVWKASGESSQGFIAHELAEVCPDAVNGEKDALDEEGNIKPQGIDTSFLTATLTAAIQELHEIVKAQAVEIAELKAKI